MEEQRKMKKEFSLHLHEVTCAKQKMFVHHLSQQHPTLTCTLFLNNSPTLHQLVFQWWTLTLIWIRAFLAISRFSLLLKLLAFKFCTSQVPEVMPCSGKIGHVLYKWHFVDCAKRWENFSIDRCIPGVDVGSSANSEILWRCFEIQNLFGMTS